MDDLVAFLRARLDEDAETTVHDWDCDRFRTYDYGIRTGECDCRWPARLRFDVVAKRQIVDLHEPVPPTEPYDQGMVCRVCGWMNNAGGRTGGFPCETLKLLAVPYAGHPDYRPEWRP